MKVVGVYPQFSTQKNPIARSTYGEPLGLGKVLALAERHGCEVAYEVPVGETITDVCDRIDEFDPDIVALSVMTCQIPDAIELAHHIKDHRKDRILLAGGYHPSAMSSVDWPFDAYVVGEGEIPFDSVIGALKNGGDWKRSPGLVLSTGRTEPPHRIACLDNFPWALRSPRALAQTYYGLVSPPPSQQTGLAFVEYGRGCLCGCVYCCKGVIWDNAMTFRHPQDVVREMLSLQRENNVNLFFFTDLNLTVSSQRVTDLCREMKRQAFSGSWFCMSNISTAVESVLEEMAEAGCVKVMYGVESVDASTLHLIHKSGTYAKAKAVLQDTLDLGMVPHLFYMIGFPWETPSRIRDAITYLQQLPGLQIRIGLATPLPGSEWYSQVTNKLTIQDWRLYDCEHLVFKHNHFEDTQLQDTAKAVYSSFYQTDIYTTRVEAFLAKWPRYEASFVEFFTLLKESGLELKLP